MNADRHFGRFRSAVAESESGEHIAFTCSAYARASSFKCFSLDFFPEMFFGLFDFCCFRVTFDFLENEIYFLHFEINDVIHHSLGSFYVLVEKFEIEFGFVGKRILDVGIKIYRKQTATVVRTKWNFAARVGGYSPESEIGITIRYRFTGDSVPEQDSRFGRFPGIVNNLVPEL